MIRTVAIIFGDNDFGKTFLSVLNTVKRVLENKPETEEKELSTIIKFMAVSHYIGFQYSFDPSNYGGRHHSQDQHFSHIIDYFESIRILVNESAEKDILTEDHDGGAWYLSLQDGKISGY